jgi:hypothetical protein
VCVEILAGRGREAGIPTYPQEQYAAISWADRNGVPVHAVDWNVQRRSLPPVVRMSDTVPLDEDSDRFRRFRSAYLATVRWTAARAFGETQDDIESLWRSFAEDSTTWAERDDSIAANISKVVAQHPGRRVAVVFGGGHYPPIKPRLEAMGIRVSLPLQYFPLSADDIQAAWHPDDAIVLVGTNLDDWRAIGLPQSRNHQRTKELLDRLRRERAGSVITRYYEARWAMLFGDLDSSRVALTSITRRGGATGLPYQANERWSWPPFRTFEAKARFYLAVAHDLAGDHEAASREYATLLRLPEDELVVPVFIAARRLDLRPYLESLVRTPYRGGMFEAFRASLALGR